VFDLTWLAADACAATPLAMRLGKKRRSDKGKRRASAPRLKPTLGQLAAIESD